MADLINRNSIVEFAMVRDITEIIPRYAELSEHEKELCCEVCRGWKKIIEGAPAVEAEPVVHAHWELEKKVCFHCSHCDGDWHHTGVVTATDYCPNCGARMDEEVTGDE